ncbi:MAG: LysR family transcriptional regulator [Deltaproteobacteria bacterium]|nr:LysR family transcriptional regulator [Deltaproteobacteria bacterium]
MTLTQLEYVLAVNRYRHFGNAAKACFVTQPTLSMQVQKLEDELGIILFDRSKSPILPTSEGELIIEQAKTVVREQKRIFDLVQRAKDELAGDFRLAVIPTLSTYILPLFLKSFVAKYPNVNLIIDEYKTEEIVAQLAADEIDAGLLVTPLHDASLIERVLYYEPFYLFVAPGHPLGKKKKIRQDDLKLEEIWLLNKGNCFRDQMLNICSEGKDEQEVVGNIRFESGNLETLKNMVLTSSGYTILPHLAVGQLSAERRKLVREFRSPVPTREVSIVYGRRVLRERVIDALQEEVLKALPGELRALDRRNVEVVEIS